MRRPEQTIGGRLWRDKGKTHRFGGPAIEMLNGTKIWYWNGISQAADFEDCSFYNDDDKPTFDPVKHEGPVILKFPGYEL